MCDDLTVNESEKYLAGKGISRRQFGTLAAGAALMAVLPPVANALAVTGNDVVVTTPDGEADCFFVHPSAGAHAAVIIWPDVLGLRPAFKQMGTRLAESGYAVLVVNPYYRKASAPVVGEGASFQDAATREVVMPYARSLTPETNVIDAGAFISYLDAQPAVDTDRGIGTTGYCMGGPMTMRTAAAYPDRIAAGGAFHAGRLVTDSPDSPHLLVPKMSAQYLFAVAENDDEREPETKNIIAEAFEDAGLQAEIEVYDGAMHGWCVPDSRVYNEAQAERAWSRLLNLFSTALA
ncbi:MAG: dienelactone hydrolase family protein [Pseudomonadaceae bacterium]|nr:dienelactone hydrolase family protein [Pseudomonadaceae bacterium]